MTRRISKESVRKVFNIKRVPKRVKMLISGCWLFDLFQKNNIKDHLWSPSYWVVLRSLDNTRVTLTWRAFQ